MMSFIKKHSYILLILLIILAACYFVTYSRYYVSLNKRQKNGSIIHKDNSKKDVISVDDALKFVEYNKLDYFDILKITFNDKKDLNNQEFLRLAYYYNKDIHDLSLGISSTKYNDYLNRLFGKLDITNEDVLDAKTTLLVYDELNDTYRSSDTSKREEVFPIYYNVVSCNNNVLKINKFYEKDRVIYSSYDDYINNVNSLFTVPEEENIINYIKNRIIIDLDSFNSDLYTYIYKFSKSKTSFIIKSYSIVK